MSLYCVIWLLLNSVDTGGFDDDEDPDAAGAASCDDDDDDDDNDGGGGGGGGGDGDDGEDIQCAPSSLQDTISVFDGDVDAAAADVGNDDGGGGAVGVR